MWGAALHGELAGNDPIHRYRSLKPTLVNTPGAVTFKSVQVGFEFAVATTCKLYICLSIVMSTSNPKLTNF
jgi:hypothetical protein